VVSAINLRSGGTLSILKDCLGYLSGNLSHKYNIVALVHNEKLINVKNVTYYEFPDSIKSYLKRMYYEYIYFRRFSKKINPHLWLSLHDITPNVQSEILAVYCHNSSPFYNLSIKEALMEIKFAFFKFFYKYLYQINIKKNDFVIVQQDWLRNEFRKMFNISNIIVAHPDISFDYTMTTNNSNLIKKNKFNFFYPSFPRIFKNFEIICEAVKIINDKGIDNFEVYLTIKGTENKYSKYIYNKYNKLKPLKFIGIQTREKIYQYYEEVDCLIFPSKLETWGLPIHEFKHFHKPILLANARYAPETIGEYDKVKFFDPANALELSNFMRLIINSDLTYDKTKPIDIEPPFSKNWRDLFDILLRGEG